VTPSVPSYCSTGWESSVAPQMDSSISAYVGSSPATDSSVSGIRSGSGGKSASTVSGVTGTSRRAGFLDDGFLVPGMGSPLGSVPLHLEGAREETPVP